MCDKSLATFCGRFDSQCNIEISPQALNERFNEFKGSGGSGSKSAIKIQLQYDLLSGSFLCCDVYSGTASDGKYVEVMDKYTEAGDLRLADLGSYKIDYLKDIILYC